MGRRADIDWERVERLYRAGQLTIQQVADECGVSNSQVRERAKKHGWSRDLSEAIAARTKEKISAIDVSALVEQSAQESAQKSAQKSAALIKDAIEQASDIAAGVIIKHRASLRLDADRADRVEALFDECMNGAESVRDVAALAQALKTLVDARAKIRDQERVTYQLDKEPDDSKSRPVKMIRLVDLTDEP